MFERRDRKRFVVSGVLFSFALAAGAWSVAFAQTPPAGGTAHPPASSAPGAACPPDAGASAAPSTTASSAPAAPATPYTGPAPYYFVRPPRTTAGLAPDRVQRVLTRPANQAAIVQCYTNVLATDARAHGVVSLRLEVIAGGFGTVDRVHIAPANDTMRDCIRDALGRFEWPNPTGVPATTVDAQIDLAPTPPANPRARH